MAITFEYHEIPKTLIGDVVVPTEEIAKITIRLRKTSRNLNRRMKLIDRKEKKSWQKSRVRN